MSLQDIYKNAGVVMKPAAMKDGKLYSQQPHSGAGDFNFSRADGVQTRINKHGLIETVANNEPRLSYDIVDGKVSDCPHLLLEPSRTNLVNYSEDFTQSAWTKNNVTVDANSTISPYGDLSASTLENGTGNKRLQFTLSTSTSNDYSVSIFFKAKGDSVEGSIIAYNSSFSALEYSEYDVENGAIGTSSGTSTIEDYGNGWYKCSLNFTATTTTSYIRFRAGNYLTGDDNSDVFIFGAQVESGTYPTSYIPTSGSTEQRQADICNGSGNSETFNDSEGVLFGELEWFETSTNIYLSLSDGTNSNRILIYSAGESEIRGLIQDGGSTQASFIVSANSREFSKVGVKYKENDFAIWINGVELATDPGGTTPSGLNTLAFNAGATASFYGKIKELTVINEALTDEQLQLLTTP